MAAEDLEPYRRLVELQKQMIEMAQQQEQSKRKCDALREQMAGGTAERSDRRNWRIACNDWQRTFESGAGRLAGKMNSDTFNWKEPSSW